jgi:hypothetical protein
MLVGNEAYRIIGAYELLDTVSVSSSGQVSVTFSNLNTSYGSTYQHLQLRMTHRASGGTRSDNVYLQLNSSTTGYDYHYLYSTGTATSAGGSINQTNMIVGRLTGSTSGAGIFGASVVNILNPFETTTNKSIRSLTTANDGTDNTIWLFSGQWRNTGALTTLTLTSGATDFVQYSTFSLYGMRSS